MANQPKPFDAGEYLKSPAEPIDQPDAPTPERAAGAARPRLSKGDRPSPTPAAPAAAAAPSDDLAPVRPDEARELGANLALAMQEGGYHPVILFGTAASGKTSMLLSLFTTIFTQPAFHAGLTLCNPLLGQVPGIAERLHDEARHTFEIKTQLFIEGKPPPKTNVPLPFFIPVAFQPADGKPPVRFAFLESNGEWYRPDRAAMTSSASNARLFPQLRGELEHFISNFQGPITFLYLAPYTQAAHLSDQDNSADAEQLRNAALAITGVLQAYEDTRVDFREGDWHHLLLTKWDVHSARSSDPDERAVEDSEALNTFMHARYGRALAAFQSLRVPASRRRMTAYCAGLINQYGVLQIAPERDLHGTLQSYPKALWERLYRNALAAQGLPPVSPFPEQRAPSFFRRLFDGVMHFVAGG